MDTSRDSEDSDQASPTLPFHKMSKQEGSPFLDNMPEWMDEFNKAFIAGKVKQPSALAFKDKHWINEECRRYICVKLFYKKKFQKYKNEHYAKLLKIAKDKCKVVLRGAKKSFEAYKNNIEDIVPESTEPDQEPQNSPCDAITTEISSESVLIPELERRSPVCISPTNDDEEYPQWYDRKCKEVAVLKNYYKSILEINCEDAEALTNYKETRSRLKILEEEAQKKERRAKAKKLKKKRAHRLNKSPVLELVPEPETEAIFPDSGLVDLDWDSNDSSPEGGKQEEAKPRDHNWSSVPWRQTEIEHAPLEDMASDSEEDNVYGEPPSDLVDLDDEDFEEIDGDSSSAAKRSRYSNAFYKQKKSKGVNATNQSDTSLDSNSKKNGNKHRELQPPWNSFPGQGMPNFQPPNFGGRSQGRNGPRYSNSGPPSNTNFNRHGTGPGFNNSPNPRFNNNSGPRFNNQAAPMRPMFRNQPPPDQSFNTQGPPPGFNQGPPYRPSNFNQGSTTTAFAPPPFNNQGPPRPGFNNFGSPSPGFNNQIPSGPPPRFFNQGPPRPGFNQASSGPRFNNQRSQFDQSSSGSGFNTQGPPLRTPYFSQGPLKGPNFETQDFTKFAPPPPIFNPSNQGPDIQVPPPLISNKLGPPSFESAINLPMDASSDIALDQDDNLPMQFSSSKFQQNRPQITKEQKPTGQSYAPFPPPPFAPKN